MILDTLDIDATEGIVLLSGERSLVAQVERRLFYFRGEYWLNQTGGIPWESLLGHEVSSGQLGAEIAAEIGEKGGVNSVDVDRVVLSESKRGGVEIDMEIQHVEGSSRVSVTTGV